MSTEYNPTHAERVFRHAFDLGLRHGLRTGHVTIQPAGGHDPDCPLCGADRGTNWRLPATDAERAMIESAIRELACSKCGAIPGGPDFCAACAAEPTPRIRICISCGEPGDLLDPVVVAFHEAEGFGAWTEGELREGFGK
jgi:hypothetical protein